MDEFKNIESGDKDLSAKVEFYRQRKAKNVAISVMLYILSVVALIAMTCIPTFFGHNDEDTNGIFGLIVMFTIVAIATGLLIYTKLSVPSDVEAVLSKEAGNKTKVIQLRTNNKKADAFLKSMMPFVLVIYLGISFWTGAWHITWIIWLIAAAIRNAVVCFTNSDEQENKSGNE